jgi:DNA polymerase
MGVVLSEAEAKSAVNNYRRSYSKVKDLWAACEEAAMNAIESPGTQFKAGDKLSIWRIKDTLWMKLPSGRFIGWQRPKLELMPTSWGEDRMSVTVHSQNTYTRQWSRNVLIGSSIFQSAVQGTARDFLAHSMLTLERNGYEIINCIHDEVLLLVDEDKAQEALDNDVTAIMTHPPKWASDFPLAAEGWVAKRYRK